MRRFPSALLRHRLQEYLMPDRCPRRLMCHRLLLSTLLPLSEDRSSHQSSQVHLRLKVDFNHCASVHILLLRFIISAPASISFPDLSQLATSLRFFLPFFYSAAFFALGRKTVFVIDGNLVEYKIFWHDVQRCAQAQSQSHLVLCPAINCLVRTTT